MLIEIKSRNGTRLYAGEHANMRDAVVAAVNGDADLRSADLRSADLRGADLRGADLGSADLRGADLGAAEVRSAYLGGADLGGAKIADEYTLVGASPILQIGPIGSRGDWLVAYNTNRGTMISTGCFFGSRDEFAQRVEDAHGDNTHGRAYRAALAMIDALAKVEP